MSYQNAEMDKLIDAARFETDAKRYDTQVRAFIDMAWADAPRVPIAQPNYDVAIRSDVRGYQYWFHLQPDYRQLWKA